MTIAETLSQQVESTLILRDLSAQHYIHYCLMADGGQRFYFKDNSNLTFYSNKPKEQNKQRSISPLN